MTITLTEPMCDMGLLPDPPRLVVPCMPAATVRGVSIAAVGRLELWQPLRQREMVLACAWGVRVGSVVYRAPAGMETDGASIPRLFWRLVDPPMYSLMVPAAIIHDAAYGGILRATAIDGSADWLPVERSEADELLELLALWNGTPAWKARAARRAVQTFGGVAWDRGHCYNAGLDLRTMDWETRAAR